MSYFKHSKILSDIRDLVKLLRKHHFENIMELYPLESLIGAKKVFYKYDIDNVVFRVSTSGMNTDPNINKIAVVIKTNYSLEEKMSDEVDIFKDYSLELFIKGYKNLNDTNDEYSNFFCWHLDKEENTNGKYIHPLYHFHAGGKKLNGKEKGDLIMISSPRIPHPPMDIIWAIHFVIQNFINGKEFDAQKNILLDDDYINIIERAQKRILDPYFHTFSDNRHQSFTPHNLFPLYV